MREFIKTPVPPYYAVIFTSKRSEYNEGYAKADDRMFELARQQPGFLGVESVQQPQLGITVSYWTDLNAIKNWRQHTEHVKVQELGKQMWYDYYSVRVCLVEREYDFTSTES